MADHRYYRIVRFFCVTVSCQEDCARCHRCEHGQYLDNVCLDNGVAAPVQAIAAGLDEGADIMGLQADGCLRYLYAEMSGYLDSTIPRWDPSTAGSCPGGRPVVFIIPSIHRCQIASTETDSIFHETRK